MPPSRPVCAASPAGSKPHRQHGNDQIRAQFGATFEQGFLPRTPQVREKQDSCPIEAAVEHKSAVVGLREALGRVGMEDLPVLD